MRIAEFLSNLLQRRSGFAAGAPPLDQTTAAPPRGEQALAELSLLGRLGQRFIAWNPDELVGRKGADIWRRMLRDPQVKASYNLLVSIIISRNWRFEPQEAGPGQQRIADFFRFNVEHALRGPFKQALRTVMLAKAQGYSVSEKVFEPIEFEGRTYWGLRAIKAKPYHSFRFEVDARGNICGLVQEAAGQRIELDPRKFVIHVFQPELDPVWGESDLRAAYRAFWEKDTILKFWNIYLERLAAGFTVAIPKEAGPVLTAAEKADFEATLRNITLASAVRLPAGYDLKVVHGPATDAFERAVDHRDLQMAKALLVPPLLGLSPQLRVGSLAQAKVQFQVFMDLVKEQGDALADVLNEQVFRDLAWWNFAERRPPLFRFDPFMKEQQREIAQTWINAVGGQAVTSTLADENRLREWLDFAPREAGSAPVRGGEPARPSEEEEGPRRAGDAARPPRAGARRRGPRRRRAGNG